MLVSPRHAGAYESDIKRASELLIAGGYALPGYPAPAADGAAASGAGAAAAAGDAAAGTKPTTWLAEVRTRNNDRWRKSDFVNIMHAAIPRPYRVEYKVPATIFVGEVFAKFAGVAFPSGDAWRRFHGYNIQLTAETHDERDARLGVMVARQTAAATKRAQAAATGAAGDGAPEAAAAASTVPEAPAAAAAGAPAADDAVSS